MLKIMVPMTAEGWDEVNEIFVEPTYTELQLEHSLVSVSKWESRWGKAFHSKKEKTSEETIDYIKCMTINKNVPPEVYDHLTVSNKSEVLSYIEAPMTASKYIGVNGGNGGGMSRDTVTAEVIYYWMIALNIPFECEKWHLNRLLALIRVCEAKNQPNKKLGKKSLMSRNAQLNAQRRRQHNSKG